MVNPARAGAYPGAMKWEYRTLKLHAQQGWGGEFDEQAFDRMLNELGEQGWELVSTLDTNLGGGGTRYLVAVFKRPRETSQH